MHKKSMLICDSRCITFGRFPEKSIAVGHIAGKELDGARTLIGQILMVEFT